MEGNHRPGVRAAGCPVCLPIRAGEGRYDGREGGGERDRADR
jgi:hypothetical protein